MILGWLPVSGWWRSGGGSRSIQPYWRCGGSSATFP